MNSETQPEEFGQAIRGEMPPPASVPSLPVKRTKRRWLRRGLVVLLLLGVAYEASFAVQIWWWRNHNPQATAFMRQGLARMQAKNPKRKLQQQWVPYDKVSMQLKQAVLAAEDQSFATHAGFDWQAMRVAYRRNVREKRHIHGGSTITQQLAKNLFLTPDRSYVRKAQEAVITVMLELLLSKRRILEIYLNVIEWGDGIYGAEAAAQHYFGVSAAQLNEEQSARLATIIPAPRRYNPLRDTEFMQQRITVVATLMGYVRVP